MVLFCMQDTETKVTTEVFAENKKEAFTKVAKVMNVDEGEARKIFVVTFATENYNRPPDA